MINIRLTIQYIERDFSRGSGIMKKKDPVFILQSIREENFDFSGQDWIIQFRNQNGCIRIIISEKKIRSRKGAQIRRREQRPDGRLQNV